MQVQSAECRMQNARCKGVEGRKGGGRDGDRAPASFVQQEVEARDRRQKMGAANVERAGRVVEGPESKTSSRARERLAQTGEGWVYKKNAGGRFSL